VGAGKSQQALFGVPALLGAALIIWLLLRRGFATALIATPLLIWSVIGFELPSLPEVWIAPRVAAVLQANWPNGVTFASAGFAEPSVMFLTGTNTAMLANGQDGARFLGDGPNRAVLVEARDLPGFLAEAKALDLTPRRVAEIDGFNYSRGRLVRLQVFANK
jgi:hypothetical protein